MLAGAVLNYGTIETETQAPSDKLANFVQLEATLVNEPHASVRDLSGQLQEDAITNYGNFTVAAGASMSLIPLQVDFGEPASFANYGALVNDGSITAYQTAGQSPGPRPAARSRATRSCSAAGRYSSTSPAPAQFFVDSISAQVKGTIPLGQKITVVGEAYNYRGDNYNGTTLGMDASTVVNDGTIVLEAQGSGTKTGGPAVLNNGAVVNNGTILAEVKDPSWPVQYEAGLDQQAFRHLERHRRRVRGQCARGGDQRRDGQGRPGRRSTSWSRRPPSRTRATGRSWWKSRARRASGSSRWSRRVVPVRASSSPGAPSTPTSSGTSPPTPISRCSSLGRGLQRHLRPPRHALHGRLHA